VFDIIDTRCNHEVHNKLNLIFVHIKKWSPIIKNYTSQKYQKRSGTDPKCKLK